MKRIGRLLSKSEQRAINGGLGCDDDETEGSAGGCKEEYVYGCSMNPTTCDSGDACCAGLKCEINATSTGTICVP